LLVSMVAAVFMVMPEFVASLGRASLGGGEIVFDSGRIAAQVVTGIGFLGAGAIIKEGLTIRGLTTAAFLWVVAGIGMASRAVKSSENESYNYELKQWAVANDGIALILSQNLATVGINNLTIDEIFLIYNTTYLYWDDIPRHAWTGHHIEIESVIRSAASGTRASFDELVEYSVTSEELGENLGFITNIGEHNEQLENPGVRDFVQNTDNAIGYVGLGFIGTNLNAAVSENGVDFYQATPDTVKAEQYPIARKLYLVTLGLPTANALAFMNFIYGPIGQQVAADQGFVPLYV